MYLQRVLLCQDQAPPKVAHSLSAAAAAELVVPAAPVSQALAQVLSLEKVICRFPVHHTCGLILVKLNCEPLHLVSTRLNCEPLPPVETQLNCRLLHQVATQLNCRPFHQVARQLNCRPFHQIAMQLNCRLLHQIATQLNCRPLHQIATQLNFRLLRQIATQLNCRLLHQVALQTGPHYAGHQNKGVHFLWNSMLLVCQGSCHCSLLRKLSYCVSRYYCVSHKLPNNSHHKITPTISTCTSVQRVWYYSTFGNLLTFPPGTLAPAFSRWCSNGIVS